MKARRTICILVSLVLAGCTLAKRASETTAPADVRVFRAVRVDVAPILDGRLDDAVWEKAELIGDFYGYSSDRLAPKQSSARILYDERYLYIGVKCLLPEGAKPAGEKREHDSGKLWEDDVVEIMIDPGRSGTDYYQLVMNAYGGTFDCSRKQGGGHEDDGWNGEWIGRGYAGEGFFSVEMAIPFHNLGITPKVGSTWGINLCRETAEPRELSTIVKQGTFHNAPAFAALTGLNVDFRKYSMKIGPHEVTLDSSGEEPMALVSMPITNLTGRRKTTKIEIHRQDAQGLESVETTTVTLRNKGGITLPLERMAVKAVSEGLAGGYLIDGRPSTKKIVTSDAETGTVLSVALTRQPLFLELMRVEVDDPWRADTPGRKTARITLKVQLALQKAERESGSLEVTLRSRKGGGGRDGRQVASATRQGPSRTTEFRLKTKTIPWGAYDAEVVFRDAQGKSIASSTALVTVLPGGRHRIKVLNNLVSELMNAGERGLLGEKEIDFMNPRDGWCFFSVAGAADIRLDGGVKAIASARDGREPAEAMRWLPAGRHTVRVQGSPSELIVRAIPELIYCYYRSDPHVRAHGPYDWEFLNKYVLRNCNVIIGGVYEDDMRAWRGRGKRWLTSRVVPGLIEKTFASADYSYKHWQGSKGYDHPLLDGIIADEFLTSASDEQYLAYTESLVRLRKDPNFRGRIFYPWCTSIYGIEGGRIFMNVVHGYGWRHCFERYLTEQASEKGAWDFIDETLIAAAKGWEAGIPGSVRKAVVTLGYMSQPTESLNIYADADFKTYMQMQFETLATNPVFFGTYGIMEYTSSYVDEENVRWAGRLYRHYGIEGRTDRLSKDPYRLTHVLNPDFLDGLKDWEVSPAEKDSVSIKTHPGYGLLQCRYDRSGQGDIVLVTRRSAAKPNVISQEIRNLEPGRVYSIKMFSGDYGHLVNEISRKQIHGITIKLDNVDVLPGPKNSFQYPITNHRTAHTLGKFKGSHAYWINYYWRVFRAKGTTARLTLSDWKSATEPGGPAGQELAINFIEVQPYLMPEDAE